MYIVLCESNDLAALWFYEELRKRNLCKIELISSEMIAYALTWEHRLSDSSSHTRIKLPDGRIIISESEKGSSRDNTIDGVLNRLVMVHTDHLWKASPKDLEYAIQELNSFFSSWLYAIASPMLNRPTPYGLSGRWRSPSEWFWLAGKCGLPTLEYTESARDLRNPIEASPDRLSTGFDQSTFWYWSNNNNNNNNNNISNEYEMQDPQILDYFVVNGAVVPSIQNSKTQHEPEALDSAFNDGFVKLSHISETALLGIRMKRDKKGDWVFADATPMPDLRLGGEKMVDAIERTFSMPGARSSSE